MTSSQVSPSPRSKMTRARRASSARPVRLAARRLSSVYSESVSLIAFLMDAIIVYNCMLRATSKRLQILWQCVSQRHLSAVHKNWNNSNIALESGRDLHPDEVTLVFETPLSLLVAVV